MKKKKETKQRNEARTPDEGNSQSLGWAPLFSGYQRAFEWVLDIAARITCEDPEGVAAVERVRTFMRKRIAGLPVHIQADDLLFTVGLIVVAIERDLGPIETLGPWFAMPLHLPSAAELWDRTIPRHFHLAQQLASALRFATA